MSSEASSSDCDLKRAARKLVPGEIYINDFLPLSRTVREREEYVFISGAVRNYPIGNNSGRENPKAVSAPTADTVIKLARARDLNYFRRSNVAIALRWTFERPPRACAIPFDYLSHVRNRCARAWNRTTTKQDAEIGRNDDTNSAPLVNFIIRRVSKLIHNDLNNYRVLEFMFAEKYEGRILRSDKTFVTE